MIIIFDIWTNSLFFYFDNNDYFWQNDLFYENELKLIIHECKFCKSRFKFLFFSNLIYQKNWQTSTHTLNIIVC